MGRTRARYRDANGCMNLDRSTGSRSPSVGTSFLPHQGDKRGATLLHKPITPCQTASLVCGLTAAPCPCAYEHRQSCPGVTQAVSYEPCFLHPTRRWSRLAGNIRALALPFSTQTPDRAVPHTFVQPIDCLMSNPCPGDTNWIPGTFGWREGVSTPLLNSLVPVPGGLPGSEPATCPRTPPAGRKFTPASTSVTGSNSSAGPETPPLVHNVPVGQHA